MQFNIDNDQIKTKFQEDPKMEEEETYGKSTDFKWRQKLLKGKFYCL